MTMLVDVSDPTHEAEPDTAVDLVSEAELIEQALAADPDQPIDADAEPWTLGGPSLPGLLPAWYMPGPTTRRHERWHVAVVVTLIVAFLLINALGLCITYGHLVPA